VTPAHPPHWSRRVFVDQAAIYAEVLRPLIPAAVPEVQGIRRILAERGIADGSRIVDIACGIGRHIVPLASAGYVVVGCDLSPGFVREARRWARKEGLPPARARFVVADYRQVGAALRRRGERPFDAALCLFTSTGFRGRASDVAVFRGVRRLVRPGGLLIFDVADRDSVLRRFTETGVSRTPTGLETHARRRFDRETSTMHSVWTYYRVARGGHLRRLWETEIDVRMYSLHELRSLFREAGWIYREAFGDLSTGEPVSEKTERLVLVLQRPGVPPSARRVGRRK
jgi:SAM-dependent methyltransferase